VTYRNKGHEDAIWAGVPVNSDAECYFGVFRGPKAPRFSPEDRDAFGYILRALKWFHRRLMLSHGLLIAETPPTPMERKVLHGLLTGRSEKEIAADIGQSYNTTHAHVGILYRKFGVKNRSALMALWISGGA
jgi:DNA-binding CsgD family transcriptional regulator